MASGDEKYRSLLRGDEEKNTKWRFGVPPNYDVVNKLFEEERTNVWPVGSLEERVQSLVKNFEMEMFHKISTTDFRTIDLNKFTFCLNGRKPLSIEETSKLGGYNPFLQTSIPEEYRYYNAAKETAASSHQAFTATFPRGFALEIIQVYSGPPDIVFKFRHWGYMEGAFKSHAPTGERIEFFGVAIFKVNENDIILGVEFFFDPGELLGKLMKGPCLDGSVEKAVSSCPILRNTGKQQMKK
ncbi:pathogen-related protein-like isoform X1 [Cucurbita moschata]|uniref:Pathogen-related protein-like isoform X1 n=2 Tax=Cucurbita moschata TaxID=3662 RepID=A0A6J1FHG3_CUCMO|nr:pathogen-related protein-like isoform X1 [Cucurbita moschata]